jgi:23S rRNA pseudouridine1911/1915/1917 synthase
MIKSFEFIINKIDDGTRIDLFLKSSLKDISRTKIQNDIKSAKVKINNTIITSAKHLIHQDDSVSYSYSESINNDKWLARQLPLNIIFEDEHLLIINKPLNLTMHPGAGTSNNTLANGILGYIAEQAYLDRAGIIHRLDKNTSGCCIVAKTTQAQYRLTSMMQNREIKRTYIALTNGVINLPNTVTAPIGRHPKKRTLMSVNQAGKVATTHYRPIITYPAHTLLEVNLDTGRTHQIRVHMSHINHPIVGDQQYSNKRPISKKYSNTAQKLISSYPQQALHAIELSLKHPILDNYIKVQAKLPAGFLQLLAELKKHITQQQSHNFVKLI